MKSFLTFSLVLSLTAPAAAQELTSILITDGVGPRPTDIRQAPGDAERLFVTSANRGIYVIKNGQLLPQLFLAFPAGTLENQQGVKSMAFHPEYQVNGKFYVVYLDAQLVEHLVQYTVSATNPDLADPASEVHLLPPFQQPSEQHNWNSLVFGPDGMLYMATGDGVWFDDEVSHTSQDLGSLLGKVLRFDVDLPSAHVPPDNPFVGVPGAREEIWHYGLRQPWRMTFDRATGDMYIGDVGKGELEEVDFVPAGASGLNFGWRCMQGTLCMLFDGCQPMCGDPSWVEPIYEYAHSSSLSAVIGGYVYRGDDIPGLQGAYIFGDNREGRVWSLRYDGAQITEFLERTSEIRPLTDSRTTTFGEDEAGELYFGNLAGEIWKIVPAGSCGAASYCTAVPNSTGSPALMDSAGSTSVSANDLELRVAGAVPQSFGIFFYGSSQTETPFGDGFLCVAGQPFRLNPPLATDALGAASRLLDVQDPPELAGEITPGSEWNFQFWYRDPGSAAASFNTSDGLAVSFCP